MVHPCACEANVNAANGDASRDTPDVWIDVGLDARGVSTHRNIGPASLIARSDASSRQTGVGGGVAGTAGGNKASPLPANYRKRMIKFSLRVQVHRNDTMHNRCALML